MKMENERRKKEEGENTNLLFFLSHIPFSIFLLPLLFFLLCFFSSLSIRHSSSVFAAWFGLDSCPLYYGVSTGYVDAQRFQAPENGTSTYLEIRLYGLNEGSTIRLGVYDDSSGSPNHKLWEGTDLSYQELEIWRGQSVTTINLTQDAYYWFAYKVSATTNLCYVSGGPTGSHKWKSGQNYANPFPNPWGSSTGQNTNRYTMRMYYSTEIGTKGIIEIDPGIIEGGIIR